MQAYIEKEDSKKLKQKQRERMQPKMGKMDIDYQVPFAIVFYDICIAYMVLCLHSDVRTILIPSDSYLSWLLGSS